MPASAFKERLIFINTNAVSPVIHIHSAGLLEPDQTYFHRGKRLSRYLFEYVSEGKGHIIKGGRQYTLTAGCFCIIRKCDEVTYYSDRDNPYTKKWFSVAGLLLEKLTEIYGLTTEVFIIRADVGKYFDELFSLLQQKGHDSKAVSGVILNIILEAAEASSHESSHKLPLADRIKSYIDSRLPDRYGLDEIAGAFNISKRHLTRVFGAAFNETIISYINGRRLAAACRFMSESDYSINEIALALNYCDQSYFANQFKKRYGIYPAAYKKKLLDNIEGRTAGLKS